MEEIFERFPDRETFDVYWKENYKPLKYEDVGKAYEEFVHSVEKHIFRSDYEEGNCISREDFLENLNQNAEFTFQDILTEIFYDKNPELYETAFSLYEAAQLLEQEERNAAQTFHEEYNRLYREFMRNMFDRMFT